MEAPRPPKRRRSDTSRRQLQEVLIEAVAWMRDLRAMLGDEMDDDTEEEYRDWLREAAPWLEPDAVRVRKRQARKR